MISSVDEYLALDPEKKNIFWMSLCDERPMKSCERCPYRSKVVELSDKHTIMCRRAKEILGIDEV